MRLMPHLRYLWYVIRHKLFVYQEGRKLGLPRWQLLVHDWHKFSRAEWGPYVRQFYGPNASKREDEDFHSSEEFDRAWLHHQNIGKHHWQYWVMPLDDGGTKVLEMPDRYRREMLADWRGAGRAVGKPDTAAWYNARHVAIQLHDRTRAWVESQIAGGQDAAGSKPSLPRT